MTANTILLVGLGELEQDDVLFWLKAELAQDLAAMRVPKSIDERDELLQYAMRRLSVGLEKVMLAMDGQTEVPYRACCYRVKTDDAERYYDEDGDPPWDRLPDWAAI